MRLGAPTHGEDQSQRYVPLSFTASGHDADRDRRRTTRNEAPAGHYMLFAVDAAGVPSVSTIVELARTGPGPRRRRRRQPRAQPPATGSDGLRSTEGPAKAVNGSASRRQRQVLHRSSQR